MTNVFIIKIDESMNFFRTFLMNFVRQILTKVLKILRVGVRVNVQVTLGQAYMQIMGAGGEGGRAAKRVMVKVRV